MKCGTKLKGSCDITLTLFRLRGDALTKPFVSEMTWQGSFENVSMTLGQFSASVADLQNQAQFKAFLEMKVEILTKYMEGILS